MPIALFEGPEAAGKSTIMEALMAEWGPDTEYIHNGPKDSWLEYCKPLWQSLNTCRDSPTTLVVWSRGWASRTVYNKLLNQGQIIPPAITKELDEIVLRSGGFLGMVTSPVNVLLQRRLDRVERGEKRDHQLDVNQELAEFQKYGRGRGWTMLLGTESVEFNVRLIMNSLTLRNPECRMVTSGELLLKD